MPGVWTVGGGAAAAAVVDGIGRLADCGDADTVALLVDDGDDTTSRLAEDGDVPRLRFGERGGGAEAAALFFFSTLPLNALVALTTLAPRSHDWRAGLIAVAADCCRAPRASGLTAAALGAADLARTLLPAASEGCRPKLLLLLLVLLLMPVAEVPEAAPAAAALGVSIADAGR